MGQGKLKHLQVRSLWLQELVQSRRVSLQKVLGTENPADLFTKALPVATLKWMRARVGVRVSEAKSEESEAGIQMSDSRFSLLIGLGLLCAVLFGVFAGLFGVWVLNVDLRRSKLRGPEANQSKGSEQAAPPTKSEREDPPKIFIAPSAGTKFHLASECPGLNSASTVKTYDLCKICAEKKKTTKRA